MGYVTIQGQKSKFAPELLRLPMRLSDDPAVTVPVAAFPTSQFRGEVDYDSTRKLQLQPIAVDPSFALASCAPTADQSPS